LLAPIVNELGFAMALANVSIWMKGRALGKRGYGGNTYDDYDSDPDMDELEMESGGKRDFTEVSISRTLSTQPINDDFEIDEEYECIPSGFIDRMADDYTDNVDYDRHKGVLERCKQNHSVLCLLSNTGLRPYSLHPHNTASSKPVVEFGHGTLHAARQTLSDACKVRYTSLTPIAK
jgi:hypothetical protein